MEKNQPFALKLTYLRNLNGKKIAKNPTSLIRKQGYKNDDKLMLWQKQLEEIIPNVALDVSLTGIYSKEGITLFYQQKQKNWLNKRSRIWPFIFYYPAR